MKSLIALSIQRPVFAWILMSALIIFGGISFGRLGISQMPDVDFPVLSVSVEYEGAAPEVVETELIDPMEQNLLSVEGIQEMRSSVQTGRGSITLTFDISRDINTALQEVQTALSSVRLPQQVDPPVVRKTNPEESPIMFIGVSSDKPLRETLEWVDAYLLDQFRFLPGIGEVSIAGYSLRNMRIWPDLNKLRQYELTLADLADALQTQHLESAAGQFSDGKKEYRVRWLGEAANATQIGKLRILRRGGQIIQDQNLTIADVARVEDGISDVRRRARVDGHEAVSISVRKQRGGNEVALAKTVSERVKELQPTIPPEYKLQINVDFTKATKAVVMTTQEKLIFASIITILVCFLFLGSFGAAINILFSIPTSIVGTFLVVYFAGFTLNLFTLLALTLAISIVVDDAIMLLENIVRHHRMGKSAAQASYDGSVEILPAAIAATLAVVAVFLPVVFMSGVIGKFFFQFGVTMSVAVLLSLLEAVTITPMRAAAFLGTSPKISNFEKRLDHYFDLINNFYKDILIWSLKHSKKIVWGSFLLFLVSLFLIQKIRQEFVPSQDQNIIMLNAQLKPGASLEASYEKALQIEKVLKSHPHVKSFFISIGGGPGANNVNQIFTPINLTSREERKQNHQQIMDELREALKAVEGVRFSFRDISARGLTSGRLNPLSFNITGPDLNTLNSKAEEIMNQLESEKIAVDLDTDFKLGLPEILIKPLRDKMANSGVSVSSVAAALNTAVAGARQSQITSGGRRYDMRIKLEDESLTSVEDISKILVRNNFGLSIPIDRFVDFEKQETFQSINRLNRQRTIGVFGNLAPGIGQARALDRAAQIATKVLPKGYGFSLEGTAAGLSDSFQNLAYALIIGIVVAYMVLAIQFNSFILPISVLTALPFSITGALLILWTFDVSLNLFSFIGIIVLMGIAKKNSILLVEFTNHMRDEKNMNPHEALIEACPVRLRPILMTSVATIAAAIPLVVGNSIGQETRTPMGLTIIGGSFVSTVFSLLVVPSIYLLLSRFEKREKVIITSN
jgi:hydrophobe/amphiphile efflux-1 (HAE1) family protein